MEEGNQTGNLQKTGKIIGEALKKMYRTTKDVSEKMRASFDARLGAMIVGIIISVIAGLATLTCIGGYVYTSVLTSLGYDIDGYRHYGHYGYSDSDDNEDINNGTIQIAAYQLESVMLINISIASGLIVALLEFSFAVVLAHSASKRVAGPLYVCYVWGYIKTVLLFITSIILYITVWDNVPGSLVLLFSALEAALTVMIYMAYKSVKESEGDSDNEALIQDTRVLISERKQGYFGLRLAAIFGGITFSLASGVLLLASVVGLICLFMMVEMRYDLDGVLHTPKRQYYSASYDIDQVTPILIVNGLTTAVLVVSLVELCFSVTLVFGLFKKNMDAMKAYLVYGVIRSAGILFVIVALYVVIWYDQTPGHIALVIFGVNLLWMAMICATHKKMKQASESYIKIQNETVQG